MTPFGTVYIVGAGPGDPQLLTLRGATLLARADVVLYDYLVNPAMLARAAPGAELICLGRHGRSNQWEPAAVQQRMVDEAKQGKTVVRLKSGDPMVFGRAAGELQHLQDAGVPFEIVPGITAAMAAASYAGVPITDRELASAVAFVAGQETFDKPCQSLDYQRLAQFPGTLVVYMGVTSAETWTRELIQAGVPADRPVALIHRCSWPGQRVIRCRLDEVAANVTPFSRFPPPVIAVVGEVARAVADWNWFERRPLHGQSVVITRPRHQADPFQQRLSELGADVLLQPAIEIREPLSWQDVDRAIQELESYDTLVFSSANGVEYFLQRMLHQNADLRRLAGRILACIGPGTTEALGQFFLRADVQPDDTFRAESLLETLAPQAAGRRMLLVRANRGREVLAEGLRAAGANVEQVVAYQSIDVSAADADVLRRLAKCTRPWITVTSSSIARSAVRLLAQASGPDARWVSISPLTSAVLRDLGIEPEAEAAEATIEGIIAEILRRCRAA